MHRKSGFKVSSINFHVCLQKRTLTHESQYFTEVQGMNAQQQGQFLAPAVMWVGFVVVIKELIKTNHPN
jgi:hypothetical protein